MTYVCQQCGALLYPGEKHRCRPSDWRHKGVGEYFRRDNTEGFDAAELAQLNANVEAVLHLWQSTPECETYADDVKNACDLVSNAFPNAPDIA